MLIIEKTFWFLSMGVKVVILAVIVLMIVRLIADAMDLNPFAWASRTVRRLSDGIVIPVRGGLRGFGIDTKFAPLVVILIAILLLYFLLRLVGAIATTVAGVLVSVRAGALFWGIGFILFGLISIYILLIIIRIVFSWGRIDYGNRIMRFLINTTEPLMGPLRRIIPPLGWLDISPIVAILILWLFQEAVVGTLLRDAPFRSF